MKKSFFATLAVSIAFGGAAFAGGQGPVSGQDTFTLQIRGYAPVICRASITAAPVGVQPGQAPLGRLYEFCNDPNGYQVWIDYSPQLANAYLLIDGNPVNLSSSGSTLITDSSQPSMEAHDLALNLPTNGVQGPLTIRVVAL